MPESGESEQPSSYMRLDEVAHQLRVSVADVRNKCYEGHLLAINVATKGRKEQLRVSRTSFEDYCRQAESAAAARYGVTA
jgi:hypothetical protein